MFEGDYLISTKEVISGVEQELIIDLYQPIVGASAIGTYQTLLHEEKTIKRLKNIRFDIRRLIELTGLTEKQFEDNIKKLEAMRLIKTSIGKKTQIKRFSIFAPLDAETFFNNELFVKSLTSKLGKENIEALKFIWKDKNDVIDDEFEETSASFIDVFQNEIKSIFDGDISKTSYQRLMSKKKTLFDKQIDKQKLANLLLSENINLDFSDKKTIKVLNWIISIKNFKEEQIAKFIINSYNFETLMINMDDLNIEIETFIIKDHQKEESKYDKQLLKYAKSLNMYNCEEFINEASGRACNKSEIRMINSLIEQGFEFGSINALVQYSLWKNNNLIVVAYIDKISKTLIDKNIFKTIEVMDYLKKAKAAIEQKIKEYKNFNKTKKTQKENIENIDFTINELSNGTLLSDEELISLPKSSY